MKTGAVLGPFGPQNTFFATPLTRKHAKTYSAFNNHT